MEAGSVTTESICRASPDGEAFLFVRWQTKTLVRRVIYVTNADVEKGKGSDFIFQQELGQAGENTIRMPFLEH